MRGYNHTEEGFKQKLRSAKIQLGETYIQFGVHTEHYFLNWVQLSQTAEDFNKLKELILWEQVLSRCSPDLVVYLKERKMHSTAELLKEAQAGKKPVRFGFGQHRKWPR